MNDRGHGWVIFASIVLGVAGIMRIFDAIWAFRYHGALPQNLEDALFGTSLKTYGWVYLIVGIILILCGFAVLGGSQLGRWVGIAAGAIGAISAIWWMPYYPIWSLTYIDLRARRLRRPCRDATQPTRVESPLAREGSYP
jgi:hypothetical protein